MKENNLQEDWMYIYKEVVQDVTELVKTASSEVLANMTKELKIKPNEKIIGDPFEIIWTITNKTIIK